jgi:hypothetical protein
MELCNAYDECALYLCQTIKHKKLSTMKNFKNILGNFGHKSELTKKDSPQHGHEHGHRYVEHSQSNKGYKCPMNCEGNKVYNAPGNCPVCNMKLVTVDDKNSDGHYHHGCC